MWAVWNGNVVVIYVVVGVDGNVGLKMVYIYKSVSNVQILNVE